MGVEETKTFFKLYWRMIVFLVAPIVLLPIVILDNFLATRVLYIQALLSVYWMCDVFNLGVTGLIPLVLVPCFGILASGKFCVFYLPDKVVVAFGGYLIAAAVEHCKLHTRATLYIFKHMGCKPKYILVLLMYIAWFMSLFIIDLAVFTFLLPLIHGIILQWEILGIAKMYENQDLDMSQVDKSITEFHKDEKRRPTKISLSIYIGVTYGILCGNVGLFSSSRAHEMMRELFENVYPDGKDVITPPKWMVVGFPLSLILVSVMIFYLELFYMGLFRRGSEDAKTANGETVEAYDLLVEQCKTKYAELGPLNSHEIGVLVIYLMCIALFLTREPLTYSGWSSFMVLKTKDSAVPFLGVVLMFIFPSQWTVCKFFSADQRPAKVSGGLVNWKAINNRMEWILLFLLGAGVAMAYVITLTGFGYLLADWLEPVRTMSPFGIMVTMLLVTMLVNQFIMCEEEVCKILMPTLIDLSMSARVHPLYFMVPSTMMCSLGMLYPMSSTVIGLASIPCNAKPWDMLLVGIGAVILSFVVVLLWSYLAFDIMHLWDAPTYPKYAKTA